MSQRRPSIQQLGHRALSAPDAALAARADAAILKVSGVTDSGRGSYRIGKKVFIRFGTEPGPLTYQFKLDQMKQVAPAPTMISSAPCGFGGMAKHGWVELRLTRGSQIPALLRLLRSSRRLYPS